MKQQSLKRCPIGIQAFEKVIEGNYLYIDKTEYIYQMANGASKYCFLSRPRRFGKSFLPLRCTAILPGRKTFSKGLPSKSWKPSGRNTRCCTLT